LAALAIYTSLAGKTSVKESEAPGTATKTFLNSPQEQSPPLQPSPTPQVSQKQADLEGARRIASPQPEPLTPQEQPASAKPTGTETVPVPQQDIQSEGTEWSPSISYQVTTKDHGLSKIIAFHYHNNKETRVYNSNTSEFSNNQGEPYFC
jgi:hypothetical protein